MYYIFNEETMAMALLILLRLHLESVNFIEKHFNSRRNRRKFPRFKQGLSFSQLLRRKFLEPRAHWLWLFPQKLGARVGTN